MCSHGLVFYATLAASDCPQGTKVPQGIGSNHSVFDTAQVSLPGPTAWWWTGASEPLLGW